MSVDLDRPYTSLLEVQDECRNHADAEVSGVNPKDKIARAINLASRFIEDHCHRDFLFHDHTSSAIAVQRRWIVAAEIFFPWPILTITEISENDVALDPSQYYFDAGQSQLTRLGNSVALGGGVTSGSIYNPTNRGNGLLDEQSPLWTMPGGGNTLRIKGTFGYALAETDPTKNPPPTVPPRVRRACTLIAAAWSGENRREVVSVDGQKNSLLDSRIPREAAELLKPHIVPVM